jgi:hypothetical protein
MIHTDGAMMSHNAGSLRWLQRGYWKEVTGSPDWATTVFGAVAVSLKRK